MEEWITSHLVEIFGAVTGIIYVFLEIRQNIWLWPVGVATSATYIFVFRDNGFYADMLLQCYYLIISIYGWWAWKRGGPLKEKHREELKVRRLNMKTSLWVLLFFTLSFSAMWYSLDRWTDSPVPFWDALITSLSVVATWMLTRKILEQWHIWILANAIAVIVYICKEMYPTSVLFIVYFIMAIAGLREWKRSYAENMTVEGSSDIV